MTLPTSELSQISHVSTAETVTLEVQFPGQPVQRVALDQEEFLIGRGEGCDLQLTDAELPLVHSEIHRQQGVLWIEAADPRLPLEINGRRYTRLALRSGDRVRIGRQEIVVRIGDTLELPTFVPQATESLTELSADELCDRILAEQEEVQRYEMGRLTGWKDLVTAIESTLVESQSHSSSVSAERLESAVRELRELSTVLAEQSRQLAQQEVEMLEVNEELRASQDTMARKLDQLLQHFGENELRASA